MCTKLHQFQNKMLLKNQTSPIVIIINFVWFKSNKIIQPAILSYKISDSCNYHLFRGIMIVMKKHYSTNYCFWRRIYIWNYRIENPVDCSHARIASTIKMAILDHANYLPLNLQMGNLLLGTTINFLIAIVKMFFIS